MIKDIGLKLNKTLVLLFVLLIFVFSSCKKNEDYNWKEVIIGQKWGDAILNERMEVTGLDSYEYGEHSFYELKYLSGDSIVNYLIIFENDIELTEFSLKEPYITKYDDYYNEYLNAKEFGEFRAYTVEEIMAFCEKYANTNI